MKQKADRKKAIRRLTALSSRLQMLGAALVLVGVVSTVQLFRTEILVKPEPTEPTQIQTTEETTVPATTPTTAAKETTQATSEATVPETSAAETTAPATGGETTTDPNKNKGLKNGDGEDAAPGDSQRSEHGGQSGSDAEEEKTNEFASGGNQNQEDAGTGGKTDDSASNEFTGEKDGTSAENISSTDETPGTSESGGDSTSTIPEGGPGDSKSDTKKNMTPQGLPWLPSEPAPETEPTVPELLEEPEKPVSLWLVLTILSNGLLILDLIAIAAVQKKLKKLRKGPAVIPTTERIPWHAVPPEIGKVHGIGGRDYQQDSLGHTRILNDSGVLAIVADGMGGLSNGEQVSQQIVMDGLGYGAAMTGLSEGNPLLGMVRQINTGVNRMLGPERIYKCGSTLISVLIAQDQFHWVSVGDSRIYLYREGYVNQLNTDHDLFQQWMPEILAGTRSYAEAARNPDGRKLTSFIGMGELKYVDYSRQPIDLRQGDRLVLVTDGVYGTVPPEQLADILKANPEVSNAAKVLERRIRDARMPHQDNYTALILGF